MRRKFVSVVLVVLCAFVFLCTALPGCAAATGAGNDSSVKYTLYIGLTDKDTNTQVLSQEEALKIVGDISLRYVDGFTAYFAQGAVKDKTGAIILENSLVFQYIAASGEEIDSIMDEVLEALNQNSVLLEKQNISFLFYEGAK